MKGKGFIGFVPNARKCKKRIKTLSGNTLKEKPHSIKSSSKGEYYRIVWYVGEKIEKFLLPLSHLFFR